MTIFLRGLSSHPLYFYLIDKKLLPIIIFFYHISPKVHDLIQNLCSNQQLDSYIIISQWTYIPSILVKRDNVLVFVLLAFHR